MKPDGHSQVIINTYMLMASYILMATATLLMIDLLRRWRLDSMIHLIAEL
jgi:hypothetical protein